MPDPADPATHEDLEDYLRIKPDFEENEGSLGSSWTYRIPEAEGIVLPVRGQAWADGLLITSVSQKYVENSVSGYYDLTISTVFSTTGGGSERTTKLTDETRYELTWGETHEKLIQHPGFMPGGKYDLTVTYSGSRGRKQVLGWEVEVSPTLKDAFQYRELDSYGRPSGTTTTITNPAVLNYCKLRLLGYDTISRAYPIWNEVTIWRGKEIPDVDTAGQYVPATRVPSLPSNIRQKFPYWIQKATPAERVGSAARWRVTRSWVGGTNIYFDVDTIFNSVASIP